MRIAIYHSLPSGGAKRALHETTRRLAADHALYIYTLSAANHEFGDVRPFARRNTVYAFRPLPLFKSPLGRLNQLQRWRDLVRLRRIEQQMSADIDREGYDVVYVQPSEWTQAPPLLHFLRTPSVYYIHEPHRKLYEPEVTRPDDHKRRGWLDRVDPLVRLYYGTLKRFDRLSTRRATARLANSRFTAANVLRIYGCSAEVSYFGVDAAAFTPGPGQETPPRVISVGALRPNKGFDFILRSLGHLPKAIRPRLSLIANEANLSERAYLETLAARCEVDLEIEVMVSQEQLVQQYRQAALFVYAPIREPFGLAPLEAMACGIPVVAVAEGGVPESVADGTTGRLVPRDPEQFAAAVQSLMADSGLRKRMGQAARAMAETRWTWDAAVKNIVRHLEAARGHSRPPAMGRRASR